MSVRVRHIIIKSSIAALLSLAATLAAAKTAIFFLGGSLDGTGLLLCILCPLAIGGPASAWQFHQHSRLKAAHDEIGAVKAGLEQAHAELQSAYRQLDERSRHDGLTGILNREGFTSALAQALPVQPGTLFICDADEFKCINDQYGHPIGDEALRALAQAIKDSLESGEIFGRIGGEEFAIFKPGIHGAAASEAANRMRLAVRAVPVAVHARAPIYLTISIGGADSRDFDDLAALWRAADTRLYAAKAGGRDRCALDDVCASAQLSFLSAALAEAPRSGRASRLAAANM